MRSEADVKKKVRAVLDKLRPALWWYMPVQTGYGVRGIPDFVVCFAGRFIAIETKDPAGKNSLTALQTLQRDAILEARGQYLVVRSDEDIANLTAFLGGIPHEL